MILCILSLLAFILNNFHLSTTRRIGTSEKSLKYKFQLVRFQEFEVNFRAQGKLKKFKNVNIWEIIY